MSNPADAHHPRNNWIKQMKARKAIPPTFAATALPSGDAWKFKNFPVEFGLTGERMPANDGWLSGRKTVMRKFIPAVLVLLGLGVLATAASAKPVVVGRLVSTKTAVERNCLIDGGQMSTTPTGTYSCTNISTGLSTNCSSLGACVIQCNGKACGNDSVRKPGAASGNSRTGTAAKPSAAETTTPRNPAVPAGGSTVVRDHRHPVVIKPNTPPPAAAPANAPPPAAGGRTTTNATPPGAIVRDHRHR